ncbi:hypothetical protein [Vibrio vulnificus]|uniref:hypothetical protein n=1 Tax=Vibrio vulnificus TaxID=672 RepID=UPI000CD0BC47|nr:hypothetical protein [Vibrio vulnificus]POC14869.1 hypothetical protein CRN39_03670 [Vibrio vulnificus]
MMILCIGGWFSGNSAILDFLSSNSDIKYLRSDFDVLRKKSGIIDLIIEEDLREKNKVIISNLKYSILKLISAVKFNVGRYSKHLLKSNDFHSEREYRLRYDDHVSFNTKFIIYMLSYFFKLNFLSIDNDNEIKHWRKWLNSFREKPNQKVIFCNPIYYDNFEPSHSFVWRRLFEPCKLLLVHRDPLDQFCDIYQKNGMVDTSVVRFFSGTEELSPVERFLHIVKKIHRARIELIYEKKSDDLLLVSFEDFIENNNYVVDQINKFLFIDSNNYRESKFFDIERSRKNINIFKKNSVVSSLVEQHLGIFIRLRKMRNELIEVYSRNESKDEH